MLSCKEVAELSSRELDKPLSLRQKTGVIAHLMMCRVCKEYVRQIRFLKRVMGRLADSSVVSEDAEAPQKLSKAARERIAARLDDH